MRTLEVKATLLNAVTTGSGSLNLRGFSGNLTFFLVTATGVTAGKVQLYEAYVLDAANPANETYTGTWQTLGTEFTLVAGTQQTYHTSGCFMGVRATVSTTVSGGGAPSVTVYVVGN